MKITEFRLPANANAPHTPLLVGNRVWFTAQTNNTYGELDPATGKVRTFTCPTPRSLPYGIRLAPDGSIWIALFGTHQLGRVNASTGALEEIVIPDERARPRRIEVAPNGMVYYTDYARGYLGRFDPRSGEFKEWRSPGGDGSAPYGIGYAPDGRVWYNESGSGTMVGFDPVTEKMDAVKIPTAGSVVRNVSVDAKRHIIWLAESGVQRLGKLELGAR
jgi:virginiamycin B lyase